VSRVVDLCAAPGGWSQVVSQKLGDREDVKIVAVDVQSMAPIEGVFTIEGDITDKNTASAIIKCFDGSPADLVLCDGAPDVLKMHDLDEYHQGQLLLAAFSIMCNILIPGGTFLAKIFRGKGVPHLVSQFQSFFKEVIILKPSTSRNSSIECFVLCTNFHLPSGFIPCMEKPLLSLEEISHSYKPVTFQVCGNETYDPDTTYPLELDDKECYKYQNPEQSPIKPAYAASL
ncbi:hypothetical protein L9F63_023214, partial [Diploptera punctata]